MRPPLVAIFFYDLFLQDRGEHGPFGPSGSATVIHGCGSEEVKLYYDVTAIREQRHFGTLSRNRKMIKVRLIERVFL